MPDDDDIPQEDLEDLIDLEYEAEMDLMRELEQVNQAHYCFLLVHTNLMLYIHTVTCTEWNVLKFGLQEAAEAALKNYEAEADKIRQKEDRPPPPSSQAQQQTRDKVRNGLRL